MGIEKEGLSTTVSGDTTAQQNYLPFQVFMRS